jgi:hypothetical protein
VSYSLTSSPDRATYESYAHLIEMLPWRPRGLEVQGKPVIVSFVSVFLQGQPVARALDLSLSPCSVPDSSR